MVASCLRDDDSADSDGDLDDPTLLVCHIVCVCVIHLSLSVKHHFSAQFAYSTVDPGFYYNIYGACDGSETYSLVMASMVVSTLK